MVFKLGRNIQVGHKVKTTNGWEKVVSLLPDGVTTKSGFLAFGTIVYGWKNS